MKKYISGMLSVVLFLTGCGGGSTSDETENIDNPKVSDKTESTEDNDAETIKEYHVGDVYADYAVEYEPEDFYSLNDTELLGYMEDSIYDDLLKELNGSEYFVENVDTIFISKEYINELNYNSKENVFFGYSLSELDSKFQGKRYIFTLGDDGNTTVQVFEEYSDDTYQRALKNVAIGAGVILVCVTVSSLTVTAAPAVSVILAASAKTGATMAVSGGALAAISSGIITGVTTGDTEQALKAAADAGSNAFKWGAISGALIGGAGEAIGLYGATANQLTMNQAAVIQRETGWPLDVIKNLHSMEEYDVYKRAGIVPVKIDGNWQFLQNVDWDFVDEDGFTNLQRVMERKLAPIGPDGKSFELHHIGQRADSPLAILTYTQHHTPGDYAVIHYAEEGKNITQAAWQTQKQEFWEKLAQAYIKGRS